MATASRCVSQSFVRAGEARSLARLHLLGRHLDVRMPQHLRRSDAKVATQSLCVTSHVFRVLDVRSCVSGLCVCAHAQV